MCKAVHFETDLHFINEYLAAHDDLCPQRQASAHLPWVASNDGNLALFLSLSASER